jgi:hypothetical protein
MPDSRTAIFEDGHCSEQVSSSVGDDPNTQNLLQKRAPFILRRVTGHLKTAAASEARRVFRLIAVLYFLSSFCETLGGEALT